jgi:nitrate reductase gamma subunit
LKMGAKLLYIYLPYIAALVFVLGFAYRIRTWAKTPVPLRIVTTPAPKTRGGVLWRIIGDALWFPSLFKGDKFLWVGGVLFHALLWLVILRHLRYFLYPVPGWVEGLQNMGLYAGYLIPLPLALLLGRRFVTERNLYISILGDYFALVLLLGITITGVLLLLFFRTYVVDVKDMILGLVHFAPRVSEPHWLFGLHFFLVLVLLMYFPFSKLMHSGGIFFSPTRNQRALFEQRFVNPWDYPVSYNPSNLFPPEKYSRELAGSGEGKKE